MAGTSRTFNASAFRAAIRATMTMGTPPVGADALKFYWNPVVTAAAPMDGEDVPFDPQVQPTRSTRAPVTVPCAVEYIDAAGQPTPFGNVIPSKVRVTLLDVDYQLVADADYVVVGGDRYLRDYEPPSFGLFQVGVHQVVFISENER